MADPVGSFFEGYLSLEIDDGEISISRIDDLGTPIYQYYDFPDVKNITDSEGNTYFFLRQNDTKSLKVFKKDTDSVMSLEYEGTPSYDYSSYLGGDAKSLGRDIYFAFFDYSLIGKGDIPPLSVQVKLLKKINGIWSEEVIYSFPLLKDYTYPTLTNKGFIGNNLYNNHATIALGVKNSLDISVFFNTYSRHTRYGEVDLLWAHFTDEWNISDLSIKDYVPSIYINWLRDDIPASVCPDSVIYDSDGNTRLFFRVFSYDADSAVFHQIIYDGKWTYKGIITDSYMVISSPSRKDYVDFYERCTPVIDKDGNIRVITKEIGSTADVWGLKLNLKTIE